MIVMMNGLPLSGKSTVVNEMIKGELGGYQVICPDDIRLAMGFEYKKEIEPYVWAIVETVARAHLLRGHHIIADATNLNKFSRKLWFKLAREFDVIVKVEYVLTSKEECIERAKKDDREYMIPVIRRMAKNREPITAEEI